MRRITVGRTSLKGGRSISPVPGPADSTGPTRGGLLPHHGRGGRALLSAALLLIMALGAACIKHASRYETPPDLTADQFESAENSLPIMVTELQWSLLHNGAHLRASGTVRNISQNEYQAVTLYGLFKDESGETLGQGSSFVSPTYLPPGREGSFEITIMLGRQKTIKHLHLITNAQVLY